MTVLFKGCFRDSDSIKTLNLSLSSARSIESGDVPIILTGVTQNDEYEGDFTERRVLTYQLDFTMKMKFYGPTRDQSIIRTINLDFEKQVPAEFFQGLNFSVGASDSASSFTILSLIHI